MSTKHLAHRRPSAEKNHLITAEGTQWGIQWFVSRADTKFVILSFTKTYMNVQSSVSPSSPSLIAPKSPNQSTSQPHHHITPLLWSLQCLLLPLLCCSTAPCGSLWESRSGCPGLLLCDSPAVVFIWQAFSECLLCTWPWTCSGNATPSLKNLQWEKDASLSRDKDSREDVLWGWGGDLRESGTSQVTLVVKNLPANAEDIRDAGLIPGSGRSPGGGHSNPLQYSCLENPMDRGADGLQSTGLQRVGYDLACRQSVFLWSTWLTVGPTHSFSSLPLSHPSDDLRSVLDKEGSDLKEFTYEILIASPKD